MSKIRPPVGNYLINRGSWQLILSEAEIDRGVQKVANFLNNNYVGEKIVLCGILKGAFIFITDLCRKLTRPCTPHTDSTRLFGAYPHDPPSAHRAAVYRLYFILFYRLPPTSMAISLRPSLIHTPVSRVIMRCYRFDSLTRAPLDA